MKRYFIPLVAILLYNSVAYAQVQQKLNIDAATVFLSGAELNSSARLNLVKGENEILFTNVAGDVNAQSITVKAANGVVVEAATFQNNYLAAEVLSPRAKEIKDSIELLKDSKELTGNKIKVINQQLTILSSNTKVGGDNTGLSVAELTKMLDLVNARMEGYLTQKSKLEEQQKKTDDRMAKLQRQLDEEQKKDYQPGGQLLVKFYAKEATTTTVAIDYVVPHAGWTPTYDIMADDANSPVKLYYKANIYQNSGVKWSNVKISLSTGNPNEGVNTPEMSPWYLSFYQPPVTVTAYKKALAAPAAEVNDLATLSTGAYQARRGAGDQAPAPATLNDYVAVDNSGVNTTFDIDLPYTIPSDGQQHLVAIKKYDVPATYRYFVVPKLDKDAFLQAQITGWEDLNLLPGQTNIFYEGTYVGQGYMDVNNVNDTMTISLGRDKKIVVKREQDKKRRSVKTIGSNVREEFAYTISVRNTRKEKINLTIQDQQPVSNDKDIVLEDTDNGGANEYDDKTGIMKWNVALAPNESRNITFGYTVKYPKGKTVTGLR